VPRAHEIVGIPSDRDGLLPDEVERMCRHTRVKAIFTVPNLQNPTVTTMSLERRMALVDVARRHGVAIIEDDIAPAPCSAPFKGGNGTGVAKRRPLSSRRARQGR
jgi:hypothetical protein